MNELKSTVLPMSPLADPVFSGMFANAEVAGLAMESFIRAVLEADSEKLSGKIVSVTPQRVHMSAKRRSCRVDIESDTDANEHIVTEIQIDADTRLMVRNLFSSSHIFKETSEKGDTFAEMAYKMPRVIHINLLDHSIRKNSTELLEPFKIMYIKPPAEIAIPNFSGYNVQLPKIEKMKPNFDNALYNWCYALYHAHSKGVTLQEVIDMTNELKNYKVLDPGFRQFCERYDFVAADPKTQKEYVNWVKDLMREQGAREASWLRGIDEGREEGILKGIETVAINMLKKNRTAEDVADATNLPVERIYALLDNVS